MARRKKAIPQYGTVIKQGVLYYRTRIKDANGKYIALYAKTPEELYKELEEQEGDGFSVLLAHRNNRFPEYASCGFDLVLSGHGHGGIIRLPFTDGLIGTEQNWFPTYTNGLYSLGNSQLVVSRGLGNVGNSFRLFNRPHIPVIVLNPS